MAALASVACATACAHVVPGQPVATGHEAATSTATWRDHVLPSDCLLSGEQMSALAGVAIDNGLDANIQHSDGTVGHSYNYYATEGGVLSFTATIKVQSPPPGSSPRNSSRTSVNRAPRRFQASDDACSSNRSLAQEISRRCG